MTWDPDEFLRDMRRQWEGNRLPDGRMPPCVGCLHWGPIERLAGADGCQLQARGIAWIEHDLTGATCEVRQPYGDERAIEDARGV